MSENTVARLTRRQFIQAAAASATTVPMTPTAKALPVPSNKSPLFRFVQWNDLHVEDYTPNDYELANKKACHLAKSLNAATHCPAPDFVVAVIDRAARPFP